jgi:hypothetical protein
MLKCNFLFVRTVVNQSIILPLRTNLQYKAKCAIIRKSGGTAQLIPNLCDRGEWITSHSGHFAPKKKNHSAQANVKFMNKLTTLPSIITNEIIPKSKLLLKKLTNFQLIKKLPAFFGSEGSLPCSQQLANLSHPQPDQSGPCPPTLLLEDPRNYTCLLQVVSQLHVSPVVN